MFINSSIKFCFLIIFTILLFQLKTTIAKCIERNTTICNNYNNVCCDGLNCKHVKKDVYKCFKGDCSIEVCNSNDPVTGCCYGLYCEVDKCKSILGIPGKK
uniref:Uncharacterized protein n=1 Tax=Meloidogyne floridensis TaxID=298350 RepID=A0A915NTA8_9BILA